MFKSTEVLRIQNGAVLLHVRISSSASDKPPLLLLHGHPQTHAMWHRVYPVLSRHFNCVMMDLRGYGDSDRPLADVAHENYSKRVMALDALAVMRHLGYEQFAVLAHDRGARVAHRLALDAPQAVSHMMLLDIAPTLSMYENTSRSFATAYWHWFFLIQAPPLPEGLIESDPVRYLHSVMGKRHAGLKAFSKEALAEYERCIQKENSARGICEDYRASASIDLEHDRQDLATGKKLQIPLRVLWGEHGAVGANFDVLQMWNEVATHVQGKALPCGHYIAEELPEALISEALNFFAIRE